MIWLISRVFSTSFASMATVHGHRHLLKSRKDNAFHLPVLHVESESQAIFASPRSHADYARLRCNRAQPCEHCTKRGDVASCSYAMTADPQATVSMDSSKKAQHTKDQLHCLEHLVAEAIKLHRGQTQSPVCSTFPFVTSCQ